MATWAEISGSDLMAAGYDIHQGTFKTEKEIADQIALLTTALRDLQRANKRATSFPVIANPLDNLKVDHVAHANCVQRLRARVDENEAKLNEMRENMEREIEAVNLKISGRSSKQKIMRGEFDVPHSSERKVLVVSFNENGTVANVVGSAVRATWTTPSHWPLALFTLLRNREGVDELIRGENYSRNFAAFITLLNTKATSATIVLDKEVKKRFEPTAAERTSLRKAFDDDIQSSIRDVLELAQTSKDNVDTVLVTSKCYDANTSIAQAIQPLFGSGSLSNTLDDYELNVLRLIGKASTNASAYRPV